MDHSDMIILMDKKFNRGEPDAVPCPNEGKPVKSQDGRIFTTHGTMSVHKSGVFLVCGRCNAQSPISKVG